MHDYQQEQPAYCGQVAQQQPVYHNQVPLPSHMKNNSQHNDLDINQEHENLKNDYESLMKQKNDLVEENQDIKNSLSELQTKMNVNTQRQGPVKEVYKQPGHVLRSRDMIGKGGAYRCEDTALRNQDLETGQILPNRKRLRPNNDEQLESTSSVDSIDLDKHHKDFFSIRFRRIRPGCWF